MKIQHSAYDSPNPDKDRQRSEIAAQVAEFERANGKIQTEEIQPRNGESLVAYSVHQGGKVKSNKSIRRGQ